jgi:hypothetical protein
VARGSRHLGVHVDGTAASAAGSALRDRCHQNGVEWHIAVALVDGAGAFTETAVTVLGHLSEHDHAGWSAGRDLNAGEAGRRRGFRAALESVVVPASQGSTGAGGGTTPPSDGERAS